MHNNSLLLAAAGGAAAQQNTTGKFVLTPGYQHWDPYEDGVTDIEEFWGFGVGGDDPYVHVSFGHVAPMPVCLFDQVMYSFGWAKNTGSGWDGLRVYFGNSDTVSWPEQLLLICHSIDRYVVETHIAGGLYGSYYYGGLFYPQDLHDAIVLGENKTTWEIRVVTEDPSLDTFPVYVDISEAKGIQFPMIVKVRVYNTNESYYDDVDVLTDENGNGVIHLPGINSFSDLPGSWIVYVRAASDPEQMSDSVYEEFPFGKPQPFTLSLRDCG